MSVGHQWPTVKLGEICSLDFGAPFKSSHFSSEPLGLPVARIRDVVRGHSKTFLAGDFDPKYLIYDGDFLIGMDGNFSIGEWRGGEALLNQRVCRVAREVSNATSREFLFHFLPRALGQIEQKKSYVTVKHLSATDLRNLKIPLPPLPEQRRIAGVLEHSSQQVRETDRQLNSLAALRSSITERALDLRKHQMLQLNEIADIQSGITKGRKLKKGEVMSEYPYMAVSNVKSGFLDLQTVKTIEVTNREAAKYELHPGDILLTEGGDPDKLGRGTIWRGEISKCLHQNHIFRIRLPENSPIPPDVLMSLISSRASRSYFLRSAKQTTGIASINKTQLSALPIPLLSAYEVIPLNGALNAIDAVAGKLKLRHTLLQELHASLAARAFSGQL
ncbi:restriction endonuclease subunit S [Corynebacterium auriscanis]|uniref:restriction endonuclease subunit S n=1 Tax=Corynebacterium auriscanis TaxID=99807 RepID=UPI003CF1E649